MFRKKKEKKKVWLSVVVHAHNPSYSEIPASQEVEIGRITSPG
jgi:hypothetical protein